MSENGELPKTSKSGGEIDEGWGSGKMPERDIDPYAAQRERAKETRPQHKSGQKPLKKEDIDTSWMNRPEPEPHQPPQKPWNKDMVKPDKAGRYRVIKPQS
ncbi:MAG TPA: hypothetical protein VFA93_00805 [Patescibacteria group bacterium]|nr:hypothetical protein [Patescibacteria group bacterium]